jgi:hypothetical protein
MLRSFVAVLVLVAATDPDLRAQVPAEGGSSATASGTLQGSAYLSRNRRVIGATVVIRSETDVSIPATIDLTATDARGGFRLDQLPDGNFRVEVNRPGLVPVVKSAVELRHPFRAVVEVGMTPLSVTPAVARPPSVAERPPPPTLPTLRLSAEMREAVGAPLADAELRLRRADGGDDPRSLRSDARGAIDGVEISSGSWQVEVVAPGFLTMRTLLDIEGDVHLRCHLVRQPSDYVPSPLELMPPENPLPPAGMEAVSAR